MTIVLLCLLTAGVTALAQDQPRFPPSNDNFTNRRGITWTQTRTVEIQEATVEANEPQHPCYGAVAQDSVWFEFYVPVGTITLSTHNSTGAASDAVMTIWTGTAITGLSAVECDDDDGVDEHAYINRALSAGMYILQVSRASTIGAAVPGTLHVNMSFDPFGTTPSNDQLANAIALTLPSLTMVSGIVDAGASANDLISGCAFDVHPHSIYYTFTLTEARAITFTTADVTGSGMKMFALFRHIAADQYQQYGCTTDLETWSLDLEPGSYYVVLGTRPDSGYTELGLFTFAVSLDLVANGGFEDGMNGWTLTKATADKRKCNDGAAGVIVTTYGSCAVVFKGGANEAATLTQTMELPVDFVNNDQLAILPSYRNNSKPNTALKLVVKIFSPSGNTKCVLPQAGPTPGYWLLSDTSCPIPSNVTHFKAKFVHKSAQGKIVLDEVSVPIAQQTSSARDWAVLPVPEAPTGFRGGN